MARIDQTIRGTPLDLSWKPVLVLLAFVVGLVSLTAWRLEIMRARTDLEARRATPTLREAAP
jgi:ABC-2 type transport system permease protein